jgi:hypothetical protein
MCPSKASSAIAVRVRPTAMRLANAPRPNMHTAANPTTTRSSVTLFAVHLISTCRKRLNVHSDNGTPHATSCFRKPLTFSHLQTACSVLGRGLRQPNPSSVAYLLPSVSVSFWHLLRLMDCLSICRLHTHPSHLPFWSGSVRPGNLGLQMAECGCLRNFRLRSGIEIYGRMKGQGFLQPNQLDAKPKLRMELR